MNDDYIKSNVLKNKFVFWDIDGTLAAFRFNGHIVSREDVHSSVTEKDIENHIFFTRKPSKFMQRVVEKSASAKNIIIGHCISDTEISDKNKWLDKYFPTIKERIFIPHNISKADKILEYCSDRSIPIFETVFVDDIIDNLREAEGKGISSWHISSFLDFFE